MRKRNALDSMHDGSLTGKREQEILTPLWLIAAMVKEWGQIWLDPCSPALPNVGACVYYAAAGLDWGWLDRTYVNPPYGDLKLWLAKALEEAADGKRIAILCPARTHRKWYRAALDASTAVVELDPLKFQGYTAAFPVPLHVIAFNWTPDPKLWAGTVRHYTRIDT